MDCADNFVDWASNRSSRIVKVAQTVDARRSSLAALQRRWIVERTFAWLGNFRRLTVRYDRSLTVYRGFFHIACFMITLRRVLK